MNKKLKTIGRQLVRILRHVPGNIKIYNGGYARTIDILTHFHIGLSELSEIVDYDNKDRLAFLYDKELIRASQGHSFDVDLGLPPITPPDILLHGTIEDFLELIFETGIKKMNRHAVHLSTNLETATQVANRRKSDTIILNIDSKTMFEDGYDFFLSDNGVWLTDIVPAKYISIHE